MFNNINFRGTPYSVAINFDHLKNPLCNKYPYVS